MRKVTQTASHWGVYNVETVDGEVVGTTPFQGDAKPATYLRSLPDTVRHELRIDRPHVRESYLRHRERAPRNRGGEAFVPVSWDMALALVESELRRVKEAHGNEAIYGGSYGWASAGRFHHSPSVLKRFLGLHGGYVDKLGNHSFGAALHIMPYVIGSGDIPALTVPWEQMIEHTRLVVTFGGTALKNTQIDSGGTVMHDAERWFAKARDRGIAFVNVSPSRDDAAAAVGAEWLPIVPNTDTAFMLGLAHTLATEGLHDRQFLACHCVGYDRFEAYLLGKSDGMPKNAGWAAAITGVPASTIEDLARRMAANRTLVSTSWSVQRADHGEQPVWMTVTLAAMLGQIGIPGGGFSLGLAATSGIAMPCPDDIPRPTLPLGPNPIRNHVPVGPRDRHAAEPRRRAALQRPRHPPSRHQADLFGRRKPVPPQRQSKPLRRGLAAARHGDRARALVDATGQIRRHRAARDHDHGAQRHPGVGTQPILDRHAEGDRTGGAEPQRLRHLRRALGAAGLSSGLHRWPQRARLAAAHVRRRAHHRRTARLRASVVRAVLGGRIVRVPASGADGRVPRALPVRPGREPAEDPVRQDRDHVRHNSRLRLRRLPGASELAGTFRVAGQRQGPPLPHPPAIEPALGAAPQPARRLARKPRIQAERPASR